jgi:hypothetical protein
MDSGIPAGPSTPVGTDQRRIGAEQDRAEPRMRERAMRVPVASGNHRRHRLLWGWSSSSHSRGCLPLMNPR